ncbi:hypothetical protein ACOBR2_20865 [Telmatobacter bradus]|uniref:hypothetical protein n=1 Tax=Telmatobacter bradus TaxID=474953 RepID=UPI003B437F56
MQKIAKYFSLLLLLTCAVLPVHAQRFHDPHPAYLHALSDLRVARWCLSHQDGGFKVYEEETEAIMEIDAAIGEIKHAAYDDGKGLEDHPPIDVRDHGSRLLRAIEFLQQAKSDIDQSEDNPEVRDLRHHANEHIDHALHAAGKAHDRWLHEMGR